MPFSHHSHSGEFCEGHAVGKLEDIVKEAIRQKMQVFALTEHMPRDQVADLYPEELEAGTTTARLLEVFDDYYREARRLQEYYAGSIELLVGFEMDWIRDASKTWVEQLLARHQWDLFIGSVHHVHGIPIDYSKGAYLRALTISASKANAAGIPAEPDEMLLADYYDAQYALLQALRPPIVGHFDLIRLMADDPHQDPKRYCRVWRKILRNLLYIKEYGGLLEVNSAAVRKGLKHPYPHGLIATQFYQMGGKFVLSDDSHGIHHMSWGYKNVLKWLHFDLAITTLAQFEKRDGTKDSRFPGIGTRDQQIYDLMTHESFDVPATLSHEPWGD